MRAKLIQVVMAGFLLTAAFSIGTADAAGLMTETGEQYMESQPEEIVELPEPEQEPEAEEEAVREEEEEAHVVTEYKSEESERYLWDCISSYSPTDEITAGIMGMFWRESFFRSDCTAHWPEVLAYTGYDQPADFTEKIDKGLADGSTREQFVEEVHDAIGGYGLGQWYSEHLLEAFYDYAQEWGTSIADAEMQCAFTVDSLQDMEELWEDLLEVKSAQQAGYHIAVFYDGTRTGYPYIQEMAKVFYDRYAQEDAVSTAKGNG